jgi:hypothetical protein
MTSNMKHTDLSTRRVDPQVVDSAVMTQVPDLPGNLNSAVGMNISTYLEHLHAPFLKETPPSTTAKSLKT